MNIGIIVQARMGSTRLPGKILRVFYREKTLLEVLLENLHKVSDVKVIVATSLDKSNDSLELYLSKKGELCYRGSENDVLDRFIKAAEYYKLDGVVRVCSDNPFLDWRGVNQLVEKARYSDADYIGFQNNGIPSILTHLGFWGEYVTLKALKKVAETTEVESSAHEHVTFHVYKHPEEYKCDWIQCPQFLQKREDIRLTVDTIVDFINAQKVYSDLKENCEDFTLQDVVDYLDTHEEITKSMMLNILLNKK